MQVVVGRPLQQAQRRPVQHRPRVQHCNNGLEPVGGQIRGFARRHDEADQALPPEGHEHAHAGLDGARGIRHGLGRQVVEQASQRRGQCDAKYPRGSHGLL